MLNIMNIIFFVTMYPTLFLMYYMLKCEGEIKQCHLFGIRISNDWLSQEEQDALRSNYRRQMNRFLILFILIPLVTLVIPYFSISFTIWMVWLLAAIAAFMLPYARNNEKLKQLKRDRCGAGDSSVTYTEIKQAGSVRALKKADFLLPDLLSVCTAIFSLFRLHDEPFAMYSILIITFAVCTPLFHLCALWTDRIKTRVISADSDVNVNYARASKKILKAFWRFAIWLNTAFTLAVSALVLLTDFSEGFAMHFILWGNILYCILLIIICGYAWTKKLRLDRQYEEKMNLLAENEENAWIGGILYYNPKDSHTIVSKKIGIGATVNMATPVGKATTIIGLLALLIIPVCCVWVMMEEFTPISLSVSGDVLTATHWKTEYELPLDEIEEVSLLEELPRTSKVSGTGMDNLEKGTFRTSADGKVQCFLNPQNDIFLRFTAGGTVYYMSGFDDTETKEIYEILCGSPKLSDPAKQESD